MPSGQVYDTGRLHIDWCPVECVPQLQTFIDTYWRQGHILARDSDLLRWQHPHPEDDELLSVLIAKEGNTLVGMLGIIPFGFCVRGWRLLGSWLAMWLAAPDWRDKLLGLRLLQRVLADNYSIVGTLGGNETTQRILAALHFETREAIPRWVRVVSPPALESLLADCAELYPPEG